jgi:hypothetical protein
LSIKVDAITPYLEPKPAGGVRVMATLSPRDAMRWEQLGRRIAAAIEPRLPREVIANRTFAAARGSSLNLALRAARVKAGSLSRRSQVLLCIDVGRFYPSVIPAVAHASLGLMGAEATLALEAAVMLDGWGSEGYTGLPIGPPASAIVANAVLAPVDSALQGLGFLRWVDDYAIGVRSPKHVPEVLDRLDCALDRLGLERSEAKTRVLEGDEPFRWLGTYGRRRTSE